MFNCEELSVNYYYSQEAPNSKIIVLLRMGKGGLPLTEEQQKVLAKHFAKSFVAQIMTGLSSEEELDKSRVIYTEAFGGPELRLEHPTGNGSIDIQTIRITAKQLNSAPIKLLIPEINKVLGRTPYKTDLGLVWGPKH